MAVKPSLFNKIVASILLACVLFLSLLSIVVYYSNEILEEELLNKQTNFELRNALSLLDNDPDAALPDSASLSIYLASRSASRAIPEHLVRLDPGVHHGLNVGVKAFHILVTASDHGTIYIQSDITEIERSEALLTVILVIAWLVLIVMVFFLARILSRKLSGPIARLSQDLSSISPDQRGVQLSPRFEDDEVGRIAMAFDSYIRKMDEYVEKQIAFSAMASHELRSPLTIIKTSADLIGCHHDNPSIEPHLDKIQRATDNMANMIHALLAITREKTTNPVEESFSLHTLIEEIVVSLGAEILRKKIRVENKIDPEYLMTADKTLVTVVLANLIRNAVKHGQQSAIEIDMNAQSLRISDSGMGIGQQELEKIFEFGFRGQNSQGYGIGLYISKLICDNQGWSLVLEPNPSGGTIAVVGFAC